METCRVDGIQLEKTVTLDDWKMAEIAFKNWIDQNLTWREKTGEDLAGKLFLAHSKSSQ